MKKNNLFLLYIVIAIGLLQSCGSGSRPQLITPKDTLNINSDAKLFEGEEEREQWRRGIVFRWVLDSTFYYNPEELQQQLDTFYELPTADGKLSAPVWTSLYGYADSVCILNYTYPSDSSCDMYPYQQQYVFDAQGHLLHQSRLLALRPMQIWANRPAVLVGVESSCEGLGAHVVYKYENGELINIFNTFEQESTPFTYNSQSDTVGYLPSELLVTAEDVNTDGWNDLVFSGKKAILTDGKDRYFPLKHPYKTLPLRYVFVYHAGKDVFLME